MNNSRPQRIVLGITGASGAPYALRVMELLAEAEVEIYLSVSKLGRRLLADELGMKQLDPDALPPAGAIWSRSRMTTISVRRSPPARFSIKAW